MKILAGQQLADQILNEAKAKIEKMPKAPRIAFVFCAKSMSAPSALFVRLKNEAARRIGLRTTPIRLPENANTERLLSLIERLNKNEDVSAVVVQLPLPDRVDVDKVLNSIAPEKDIDGLGEKSEHAPAAAGAILRLLEEYQVKIKGAKIVVLGDGRLVGMPVGELLRGRGARVEILGGNLHLRGDRPVPSAVEGMGSSEVEAVGQADIIICATGQVGIIGAENIKKGAVVIDCGNTKETREFRFNEEAEKKLSALSPVPGGVGPLTIAVLLARIEN